LFNVCTPTFSAVVYTIIVSKNKTFSSLYIQSNPREAERSRKITCGASPPAGDFSRFIDSF